MSAGTEYWQAQADRILSLAIRYALLKYSNRVYVSDITLRNMVQLCIRAKTFIPKNTSIEELGGIMSINAVDVFNQHGRKQEDWEPEYETFSIIRASSGQRGVGMRKDRLLMGPLRFVNHSCAPNAEVYFPPMSLHETQLISFSVCGINSNECDFPKNNQRYPTRRGNHCPIF